MSHEEFELAARELPLETTGDMSSSHQVGSVIFTTSFEKSHHESIPKVPTTYLVQVAEVLEEVAQATQESDA